MKKLLLLLGCVALYSCSDDFKPEASADTRNERSLTLNLLPFDDSGIIPASSGVDVSANNKNWIQAKIDSAHANGYDGLEIGALDCYVDVTYSSNLKLPSNFTLAMGEDTYLRVNPNDYNGYCLIEIKEVDSVNVYGGHLIGERTQHTFVGTETDEHGHLMRVVSADHIVIDGVSFAEANGDGLYLTSSVISNQPNYQPSTDTKILNCTFDSNRRDNISICDGSDIEVAFCTFFGAGNDIPGSNGTFPKTSVNVEGVTGGSAPGGWYLHPQDIHIHHNTESGSKSAYLVAAGDNITIEHNTSTSTIGYSWGTGIIVRENTVNSDGAGTGIVAGTAINPATTNNVVYKNKVYDAHIGIQIHSNDMEITYNEFVDCAAYAINFYTMKNVLIKSNVITSSVTGSCGIKVTTGTQPAAELVNFTDNTIEVTGGTGAHAVSLIGVNRLTGQSSFTFNMTGNSFKSTGTFTINAVTGAKVYGNLIEPEYGTHIGNVENMEFDDNIVTTNSTTANVQTVLIKNCVGSNNFVRDNTIWNKSSNGNAHCIQVMGTTSNMEISGNDLKQNVTRTLHIASSSNLTVSNNVGDIGSSSLFLYATGTTGCTFTNNTAVTAPHTRQSINGVVTIL